MSQTEISPDDLRSARKAARIRRRRAFRAFRKSYRRSSMGMWGFGLVLFFIALALFAPLIVSKSGLNVASATGPTYHGPTARYPFGTDNFGRSVLILVIYGARISLIVGLAATVVTMVLGTAFGVAAGYLGGWWDKFLNAFTNWFLVIPWIPLAIVMAAILGANLINIILIIGITSWAGTARLVRAQTLTVKERAYVERARALGASDWHLVSRHILPNVFPVIFANTILTVALSILSETTLSLLGLGDPNSISWGQILDQAFRQGALTIGDWWWVTFPGLAIVLLVLAFTMCGYAFDDIINPKLRER